MVALGSNALRFRIGARLRALGFGLPPVVHPTAFLAPSSRVADGAVVMARAVLGTDTSVSSLAIVNTGAILEPRQRLGPSRACCARVRPGRERRGG